MEISAPLAKYTMNITLNQMKYKLYASSIQEQQNKTVFGNHFQTFSTGFLVFSDIREINSTWIYGVC